MDKEMKKELEELIQMTDDVLNIEESTTETTLDDYKRYGLGTWSTAPTPGPRPYGSPLTLDDLKKAMEDLYGKKMGAKLEQRNVKIIANTNGMELIQKAMQEQMEKQALQALKAQASGWKKNLGIP
jgi:histidinol dehydrogenase